MGQVVEFPASRIRSDWQLTKAELAERWNVSERWIEYRMQRDGLPYVKDSLSRLVRFPLAACERWRATYLERTAV